MECKLKKSLVIGASMCDNTAKLSVPNIFALFMDLATEHAVDLDLGAKKLAEHGVIWVTVRTKVNIYDRPEMTENVICESWPEAPGRIRCNRYYRISSLDGQVLVDGKTEWAMLDIINNRPYKISDIYPSTIEHLEDIVCPEAFARIPENFEECGEKTLYAVRSTDIDLSQHMNNAAYVRAIFSAFSCDELKQNNIKEIDVSFRTQCYENDDLSIRLREGDGFVDIGVVREDGKIAVVARVKYKSNFK